MVYKQYYIKPYLTTSKPAIDSYTTDKLDTKYSPTLWKPRQSTGSERTDILKCLQLPSIGDGFTMIKKSDAHEGFSLMAQRDGIPITIICNNAKEQIMGNFQTVS